MKFFKEIVKRILFFFICKFPLQKKVVFCNFNGRGFGDDPKYITQELLKRNTSAKLVWLTRSPSSEFPKGVKTVLYGSFFAKFQCFTARVWVFNTKNVDCPPKRDGQYYIQTWHGGIFGLKKVEKAVENVPEFAEYVARSKQDSKMIDLMYSDNDFIKKDFETNFWYDGPVIKCGIPRVSILKNVPKEIPNSVRKKYNVSENVKIVLYAPTFRGTKSIEACKWNFDRVIDELQTKFGCQIIMFLRLHPNIASRSGEFVNSERVRNVSSYPDMQELLATADFCISDYSSSYFEFACLRRKPVFLICLDYDSFTHNERSFHLSLERIPFDICKSVDELCEKIRTFSEVQYQKRLDSFCDFIGLSEDGSGACELADIIESKLN